MLRSTYPVSSRPFTWAYESPKGGNSVAKMTLEEVLKANTQANGETLAKSRQLRDVLRERGFKGKRFNLSMGGSGYRTRPIEGRPISPPHMKKKP